MWSKIVLQGHTRLKRRLIIPSVEIVQPVAECWIGGFQFIYLLPRRPNLKKEKWFPFTQNRDLFDSDSYRRRYFFPHSVQDLNCIVHICNWRHSLVHCTWKFQSTVYRKRFLEIFWTDNEQQSWDQSGYCYWASSIIVFYIYFFTTPKK